MMSIELKRSITEVLEILKYMDKSYTEKLPEKFIKFLQDNKDTSYTFELNYTKIMQDYNISKETKKLLGIIYLKYWSNTEQQKEYIQTLDKNQQTYEEKIKRKYNTDNIFKNSKKEKNEDNLKRGLNECTEIIECKENIFQKILNKIKTFFKKKLKGKK